MCRLKIKIRVVGKRHQKFIKFTLVPKDLRQYSRYLKSFGYWDLKPTFKNRFIVLNIYQIFEYYSLGATPNKQVLNKIYNYFNDIQNFHNWTYFRYDQIMLFVENEIKKKYLQT